MPTFISSYTHMNGRFGVLVEIQASDPLSFLTKEFQSLAHEIALHIVAACPKVVSPSQLQSQDWFEFLIDHDPELIKLSLHERNVRQAELRKEYEEQNVLIRQLFVKDKTHTVNEVMQSMSEVLKENLRVIRFVRWEASDT